MIIFHWTSGPPRNLYCISPPQPMESRARVPAHARAPFHPSPRRSRAHVPPKVLVGITPSIGSELNQSAGGFWAVRSVFAFGVGASTMC